MPKYRKKPVLDDAEQFLDLEKPVRGISFELKADGTKSEPFVTTVHGQKTYVALGDYIVKEREGSGYYPCKPDIFVATHDMNYVI